MSRSAHPSRQQQKLQQQQLLTQQQQVADNEAAAAAAEIFDLFCVATTMRQILGLHRNMCDLVGLRPAPLNEFYPKLKAKVRSWKAQALWKKFDTRAAHRVYSKGNAGTGTRVLVIGAGPCGLRTAIEAQLLGAKVVVIEKRDRISRNNVLHLWPFVITDLRNLGAKKFYGKFCAGSIDHISIRQLQCILLKVALLLGVEIHEGISFERSIEPTDGCGWRAEVIPSDHAVSHYEFDVLIGADGKRNTLEGFKRKEFRGKLAIAITANFINKKTEAEAKAEEISGVAFIFNQSFFKDLYRTTGIDLENIVYYKDETHYFVMTAKKHSLIDKGVIIQDFADPAELLALSNVNKEKLLAYAREAAEFSTKYQMPNLEFAVNHYGKPDVAMFDFTSMFAAETSCRVIVRKGYRLLQCLVGDSLLEPFWPTGSGCARGFLSSMDAAYAIKLWSNPQNSILGVLAQRESIYRLLNQTTPENLQRDIGSYTVDPATRYPNLNRSSVNVWQVKHLVDTDDNSVLEQTFMDTNVLQVVQTDTPVRRKRRSGDSMPLSTVLLRWISAQLHSYDFSKSLKEVSDVFINGKVLCALINRYRPDLVDFNMVKDLSPVESNELAFTILDKDLHIPRVMTGKESVQLTNTESKVWLNYLEQICEVFRGEIPHVKHPKIDFTELKEKYRSNYTRGQPDFSKLLQISTKQTKSRMQDIVDIPTYTGQRRSVLDEEKHKKRLTANNVATTSGQVATPTETPRRAKKRRNAEKPNNIEDRQKRLQEIEQNRQERLSKRRQQRFQQTQNFYKSLHMLQVNTLLREADENSIPFEDYSLFIYRQQAPVFNDRVKDLERKLLYPDRERGDIPSALPRSQLDEQFSDRIKSMEQRISSKSPVHGTEKKPKDLMRAIGKIDSNDWNVREIEKKIEQSKKTEVHGPKGREKVPKWSKEQFVARQNKMAKPLKQDSKEEEKFKEIDQTLKNLDKQLKEGHNLDIGERGRNKVASIAGQFVKKPDDTSEEKNPSTVVAKPSSKVALAFKKQAASEKCHFCKQTVYLMEKVNTEGLVFHRSCLKCHHCHTNLRLGNYAFDRDDPNGRFYCTQHYRLPAKAVRPVVRKPGQRKVSPQIQQPILKSPASETDGSEPHTLDKTNNQLESLGQQDMIDRGQTPERIEIENTDAMSDGDLSEDHIIDEHEWSGRNFLPESNDSESDLSSSDESDTESDSELYEEANESPLGAQTLQLATDWIGKQHYSDSDGSDEFYDSSDGIADDGKDDSEGEEIKKARELRREEVRLLPLPPNLPTDTETEAITNKENKESNHISDTVKDIENIENPEHSLTKVVQENAENNKNVENPEHSLTKDVQEYAENNKNDEIKKNTEEPIKSVAKEEENKLIVETSKKQKEQILDSNSENKENIMEINDKSTLIEKAQPIIISMVTNKSDKNSLHSFHSDSFESASGSVKSLDKNNFKNSLTPTKFDIEKLEQNSENKISADIEAISEKLYRLNNMVKMNKDLENLAREDLVKSDINKKLTLKEKWLVDNDPNKKSPQIPISSPSTLTSTFDQKFQKVIAKSPEKFSDLNEKNKKEILDFDIKSLMPRHPNFEAYKNTDKEVNKKSGDETSKENYSKSSVNNSPKLPQKVSNVSPSNALRKSQKVDIKDALASDGKMEIENILDIVKKLNITNKESSDKSKSVSSDGDVEAFNEIPSNSLKKLNEKLKEVETKQFSNTMDFIKSQMVTPTVTAQTVPGVDLSKYFPNQKQEKTSTGVTNKNQKNLKDVDLSRYFPESPGPQRRASVVTVADKIKKLQSAPLAGKTSNEISGSSKAKKLTKHESLDSDLSLKNHQLDGAVDLIPKKQAVKINADKGKTKIIKNSSPKTKKTTKKVTKKSEKTSLITRSEDDRILDEILHQSDEAIRSPSTEYQKLFNEEKSPSDDISDKIELILEETGIDFGLPKKNNRKKLCKALSLEEKGTEYSQFVESKEKEDVVYPSGVKNILKRFESMSSNNSDENIFKLKKIESDDIIKSKSKESLMSSDPLSDLEKTMEYLKKEWRNEATNFLQKKRNKFFSDKNANEEESKILKNEDIEQKKFDDFSFQYKDSKLAKFFGIKSRSPEKRKSPKKKDKSKSPNKKCKKSSNNVSKTIEETALINGNEKQSNKSSKQNINEKALEINGSGALLKKNILDIEVGAHSNSRKNSLSSGGSRRDSLDSSIISLTDDRFKSSVVEDIRNLPKTGCDKSLNSSRRGSQTSLQSRRQSASSLNEKFETVFLASCDVNTDNETTKTNNQSNLCSTNGGSDDLNIERKPFKVINSVLDILNSVFSTENKIESTSKEVLANNINNQTSEMRNSPNRSSPSKVIGTSDEVDYNAPNPPSDHINPKDNLCPEDLSSNAPRRLSLTSINKLLDSHGENETITNNQSDDTRTNVSLKGSSTDSIEKLFSQISDEMLSNMDFDSNGDLVEISPSEAEQKNAYSIDDHLKLLDSLEHLEKDPANFVEMKLQSEIIEPKFPIKPIRRNKSKSSSSDSSAPIPPQRLKKKLTSMSPTGMAPSVQDMMDNMYAKQASNEPIDKLIKLEPLRFPIVNNSDNSDRSDTEIIPTKDTIAMFLPKSLDDIEITTTKSKSLGKNEITLESLPRNDSELLKKKDVNISEISNVEKLTPDNHQKLQDSQIISASGQVIREDVNNKRVQDTLESEKLDNVEPLNKSDLEHNDKLAKTASLLQKNSKESSLEWDMEKLPISPMPRRKFVNANTALISEDGKNIVSPTLSIEILNNLPINETEKEQRIINDFETVRRQELFERDQSYHEMVKQEMKKPNISSDSSQNNLSNSSSNASAMFNSTTTAPSLLSRRSTKDSIQTKPPGSPPMFKKLNVSASESTTTLNSRRSSFAFIEMVNGEPIIAPMPRKLKIPKSEPKYLPEDIPKTEVFENRPWPKPEEELELFSEDEDNAKEQIPSRTPSPVAECFKNRLWPDGKTVFSQKNVSKANSLNASEKEDLERFLALKRSSRNPVKHLSHSPPCFDPIEGSNRSSKSITDLNTYSPLRSINDSMQTLHLMVPRSSHSSLNTDTKSQDRSLTTNDLKSLKSYRVSASNDDVDASTQMLLDRSKRLHNRKRDFVNERVVERNPYMREVIQTEKTDTELLEDIDDVEGYRPKHYTSKIASSIPRFPTSKSTTKTSDFRKPYNYLNSTRSSTSYGTGDYGGRYYLPNSSTYAPANNLKSYKTYDSSSRSGANFVDYFRRDRNERESSKESCVIS